MRITAFAALVCLCRSAGFAQQPAPPPAPADPATAPATPQASRPKVPLTPAEEREKYIQLYDPLNKTAPVPNLPDVPGAQSDTPPQPNVQPPVPDRQTTPLPGSAAASNSLTPVNPRTQGPQVVTGDTDAPSLLDYSGPAVLSRSYTLARPAVPQQLKFSPNLGFTTVYDTGLSGGTVKPDGTLASVNSFGTVYTWGLTGRHFWKHDQVGLQYSGNYNRYTSEASYNGLNQFLNADYGHEFSRRLSVNAVVSASSTSIGNALVNQAAMPGLSAANIDLAVSPSTQILDQGTRQLTSMLDLTWRQSSRLSINLGGGFFAVDRAGAGSTGNIGYQSRADVNYRYTRRMTIGVYYSFTDYAFAHQIELSNAHTVGGIYSYALGRASQIRLRAGVTRSESKGLTTVFIDPVIAALIGRGVAIVDEYRLSTFSDVSAQFVKDFGHTRTANISYAHGLAPGNGVEMTSIQQTESASFAMLLFRKYRTNASVSRTSLTSVSQSIGSYGSDSVSFGLQRSLAHGMATNFDVSFRRFSLVNQPTVTTQFRISTGISWGPGENKLW